jgi:hypothetical protein
MNVGKHKIFCNLEQEDGKEAHKLTFAIDAIVTCENPGAKSTAPRLPRRCLVATAVDNTFNVLQGVVVEQINVFVSQKCDEALKPAGRRSSAC